MAGTNDFLPFATGGGALVKTQAEWEADPVVANGFNVGIADEREFNKAIRQPSFVAAAIAQWMADILNENILDNTSVATFLAQFWRALLQGSYFIDTGAANAMFVGAPFGLTFPAPPAGIRVSVKVAHTNGGGGVTFDWMGTTNAVVYSDGSAIGSGDFPASGIVDLEFDGVDWQCLSLSIEAINRLAAGSTSIVTLQGEVDAANARIDAANASIAAADASIAAANASILNLRAASRLAPLAFYGVPGISSFIIPASVFSLYCWCLAGGGAAGSIGNFNGGGGGSGGFVSARIKAVTPGNSITITVGAGGIATAGADGSNGGSSSIGAFMSASGGTGGNCIANAAGGNPGVGTADAALCDNIYNENGGEGTNGTALGNDWAGIGAASFMGGGTRASTVNGTGNGASGSGGGGAYGGGGAHASPGVAGGVFIWAAIYP